MSVTKSCITVNLLRVFEVSPAGIDIEALHGGVMKFGAWLDIGWRTYACMVHAHKYRTNLKWRVWRWCLWNDSCTKDGFKIAAVRTSYDMASVESAITDSSYAGHVWRHICASRNGRQDDWRLDDVWTSRVSIERPVVGACCRDATSGSGVGRWWRDKNEGLWIIKPNALRYILEYSRQSRTTIGADSMGPAGLGPTQY